MASAKGKDHGRVVLKAAKPLLVRRLNEFCEKLEWHRAEIEADLQQHLDTSRKLIVDYYLSRVVNSPPDSLVGQLLTVKPSDDDAKNWLEGELSRVFPKAESLILEMKLDVRFKDITFETLNREDFLESVKDAFPTVDWDKAYDEFRAAGESGSKKGAGA